MSENNNIYKIVVVDDTDIVRGFTASLCEGAARQAGMTPEIHEFDDGAPALEYLKQNASHLLVTDLNMKKLHGPDLIFCAKQLYRGMPAILMSGGSPDAMKSAAVTADALGVDFLEKPLLEMKLLEDLVIKYAPKPVA